MSRFKESDIRLKILSIQMLQRRGYDLAFESELLEMTSQELRDYYNRGSHLITHSEENRILDIPEQDSVKLARPNEFSGVKSYLNFPCFLNQCLKSKNNLEARQHLSNIYYHPENKNWILVYFTTINTNKLSQNEYRSISFIATSYGISKMIFITRNPPTPQVVTYFTNNFYDSKTTIKDEKITTQLIYEDELLIDIMNSIWVPKYRVISQEEKRKAYHGDTSSGRHISASDPVVKYMGWSIGTQLIEEVDLELKGVLVNKEITFLTVVSSYEK